jgi:hypothetical protein
MISHILDFPETITGATFQKIHTTHLLNSIKTLTGERDELTTTDLGDSSIICERNKTTIISPVGSSLGRRESRYPICWGSYCFCGQIPGRSLFETTISALSLRYLSLGAMVNHYKNQMPSHGRTFFCQKNLLSLPAF